MKDTKYENKTSSDQRKTQTTQELLAALTAGEESAKEKGWISFDDAMELVKKLTSKGLT